MSTSPALRPLAADPGFVADFTAAAGLLKNSGVSAFLAANGRMRVRSPPGCSSSERA